MEDFTSYAKTASPCAMTWVLCKKLFEGIPGIGIGIDKVIILFQIKPKEAF